MVVLKDFYVSYVSIEYKVVVVFVYVFFIYYSAYIEDNYNFIFCIFYLDNFNVYFYTFPYANLVVIVDSFFLEYVF